MEHSSEGTQKKSLPGLLSGQLDPVHTLDTFFAIDLIDLVSASSTKRRSNSLIKLRKVSFCKGIPRKTYESF